MRLFVAVQVPDSWRHTGSDLTASVPGKVRPHISPGGAGCRPQKESPRGKVFPFTSDATKICLLKTSVEILKEISLDVGVASLGTDATQ